jgi:AGZA family xanthine/uracil permease-like MFS transporter
VEKIRKGLNDFFKIEERGSTITRELLGGLTIFLAMVYILPVNAGILSSAGTGLSFGAVFAATAIAAGLSSIIMGVVANYPVGLASGMGVNALFVYTGVYALGFTGYEALAAVFVSGVLFLVISLTGVREAVINAIPKNLKLAIGAGIGFFIAFIGLQHAGIIGDHVVTLVTMGDLSQPTVLLALGGILLVFILYAMDKKVSHYAVIISIVAVGLVGVLLGEIFPSLASEMPSLTNDSMGSLSDMGDVFGKAITSLPSLLSNPMAYALIFSFLFVDFFDTSGTLVAVGHDANLFDKDGNLINADKALLADAIGTVAGSIFGTSTVTSFIESSIGIKQGSRTGLTAVTVGVLFLLSLLIYPAFGFVSSIDANGLEPVTALALVYVGALMIG